MTTSISMPARPLAIVECDFVELARSSYDIADGLVNLLSSQRKAKVADRRDSMNSLRYYVQSVENNLWEALARDFPKFKFRRQNQTIVISYNTSGQTVTIAPGEVSKIQSWGVNDYYEALDTINRLENNLYNNGAVFNRRWKDDWKRLGHQLLTIDRRNCKGFVEPTPGPVVITPPASVPLPPSLPGPQLPKYPCPAIPAQGSWSTRDTRNWSVMGWNNSQVIPMANNLQVGRPSIVTIAGRELIYYSPVDVTKTPTTKVVWLFHGRHESARTWFTDYEKVKYIKKLTDAGFIVVAYDSQNRISRKWALSGAPSNNREIIDLKACQDYLASAGVLKRVCTSVSMLNPQTGQTTISESCSWTSQQFGVGMHTGGAMASFAASALGLSKVILHNSQGATQIIRNANYNVNTLWMLSANDLGISNSEALDNYSYLQSNKPSLTTALYTQVATKITAAIFDDITNITTPIAEAIISGLTSGGFIDGSGVPTTKYSSANNSLRETYLQVNISAIVAAAFDAQAEDYRKYLADVIEQIRISFSDEEFSGWQRTVPSSSLVLVDRDLAFLQA